MPGWDELTHSMDWLTSRGQSRTIVELSQVETAQLDDARLQYALVDFAASESGKIVLGSLIQAVLIYHEPKTLEDLGKIQLIRQLLGNIRRAALQRG